MPLFLSKLLRVLLAVALAAGALVLASLFVALFVAAGLLLGGWLWWRTRQLRRAKPPVDVAIIEGEYRVVGDVTHLKP